MLPMHQMGSLLPKCILCFVTKSKGHISYSVLRVRFMVFVVPVSSPKINDFFKSKRRIQYCLTECISSKLFTHSKLELLILPKTLHFLFHSSQPILGHSASWDGLSDENSLTVLFASERRHDLLLQIIKYSHRISLRQLFPPLLRIDLSPVSRDATSVVETSDIA